MAMKLRRLQANAMVFSAGAGALGLAACMHSERPLAIAPQAAPSAYRLFYMDEGSSAKLAYGAPNSDDVSLMMQCAKGSHMIDISDVARDGTPPTLLLASSGKSARLTVQPSSGDGETLVVARAQTDAQPLRAFRRSGRIEVVYSGTRYVIAAGAPERVGVEHFFSDCDRSTATIAAIRPR